MKVEVVCRENKLQELLKIDLVPYEKAIEAAFDKIEQHQVVSSWKDALTSQTLNLGLSHYIEVPAYGCFKYIQTRKMSDPDRSLDKIWSIGGTTGWYYANWLWIFRGFLDKLFGGVGLRRGRKHPKEIFNGEALDFWRVLFASREEKRILLYAEMKLPGEAWLEFRMENDTLIQEATFRPKGLAGRLYWYFSMPFHLFIFPGMINQIAR